MDTRIRRAAFGLLLLLLLGSMTACKQTETIKVLQFNIWQEGTVVKGGFEAVADEIARTDADFVTLSEVRNYHDTRFCDRILFVKDGGIAEEGTHEELLQKGGAYAKLFNVQARYYQEGRDLDDIQIG